MTDRQTRLTLTQTGLWNGLAVAIRLSTAIAINKILAVLIGPAGFAAIGQFQNVVQIFYTLSTGAIDNGVTKYTSEYANNRELQKTLWSTSLRLVIFTSVFAAAILVFQSQNLAEFFLKDRRLATVFLCLAPCLVLFALNALALAIVNGRQDLRTYVVSNISGSVIALGSVTALTWLFGLYGTLVAVAINQALVFFVTIGQLFRRPWFRTGWIRSGFSKSIAIRLYSFAIMGAVSAISIASGQVLVRSLLQREYGGDYPGLWEAMIKISQINMIMVATTMSLYYIPRISRLEHWTDIRKEILEGARLLLPLFACVAVAIYYFRALIIDLLFTGSFAPMEALFGWQLAGDTVRVASWFLAYVMIGRAMVKTYVATEILTNCLFFGLSVVLVRAIGFEGVALAHFVTYVAATVAMYIAVVRSFEHKGRQNTSKG